MSRLLFIILALHLCVAQAKDEQEMPAMHHLFEVEPSEDISIPDTFPLNKNKQIDCQTCHGIKDMKEQDFEKIDKQDEKFFSFVHLHGGFGLEGALEKYGYKPEDITDMVISHLHYDHCGGGVKNSTTGTGFEMVFPNATYWVSKQQWEWAKNPNKREATAYLEENILPMQESGQLKFIEENIELYPGFNVRLYNGHTEGQIIPFISYQGKTVVYMADLIPSSAHINLAWNMSYDVQPLITLKEKEQFLKEAYENDYILFLEHDAYNECCTIEKTKKGYRAKETFTLEEYFGKS